MARVSTKKNKNIYQTTREGLGLTREAASQVLETIPPERLVRIESDKYAPYPDEVLTMARAYKEPALCNHYCARQCPIGQQYVPEIKMRELSQIVLEMLASLNSLQRRRDTLIDISADGTIAHGELQEFVNIQKELERITATAEALRLWSEQMLATGRIDPADYQALKDK